MYEAYMTAAEKGMQKQLKNCKNNNLGAVKKLQQKRATILEQRNHNPCVESSNLPLATNNEKDG